MFFAAFALIPIHSRELVLEGSPPRLPLRSRPPQALTGSAFARTIESLPLEEREQAIEREVLKGNVPSFLRSLRPVSVTEAVAGAAHELVFYALPDYLAVGSESDYLYVPTTPYTAQRLADRLHWQDSLDAARPRRCV